MYFTRYLAQRYLLDGKSQTLKSDKDVKIYIKSIALECITNVVTLLPSIIYLSIEETDNDDRQYMWDLFLYINHQDDKMKTQIILLIGNLINTILLQSDGNYEKWLEKVNYKNSIPGINIVLLNERYEN